MRSLFALPVILTLPESGPTKMCKVGAKENLALHIATLAPLMRCLSIRGVRGGRGWRRTVASRDQGDAAERHGQHNKTRA